VSSPDDRIVLLAATSIDPMGYPRVLLRNASSRADRHGHDGPSGQAMQHPCGADVTAALHHSHELLGSRVRREASGDRAASADWSGVASPRRIESGRGQACPGPSHTTRHAGPHRAVRSAFPETAVGIEEPFQTGGLVPVGVRQRALEWPGPGNAPISLLRRRP
jgi:hypothetical protein